jgi:hypothetical protein
MVSLPLSQGGMYAPAPMEKALRSRPFLVGVTTCVHHQVTDGESYEGDGPLYAVTRPRPAFTSMLPRSGALQM